MKIVWWTVASPFAPTGYGRVTHYMVKELEKLGHEVHVFCAFGLTHGNFTIDGFRLYGNPVFGSLGIETGIKLFNNLGADLIIYMGDFWPYAESVGRICELAPTILHSPIDHFPVTLTECSVIRKARMLATLSRCSVNWVKEAGCQNVMYAPHGVNLEIYHPGDCQKARKSLGWPLDKFIYLNVATNKGDRKNHYGLLRAYSDLLLRRPDQTDRTMLAIHTYPFRDDMNPEGYDLYELVISLGLNKNVMWVDSVEYLAGIPESQLALMYQACDVHVLPSKTEGFGLPLIEAGACGIPSITTNFSSMSEIVGDKGWLIDVAEMEIQQLVGYSWQSIPSTRHLSKFMEYVYDHPSEVFSRGDVMKTHVEAEYSWQKAASHWPEILERAVNGRLQESETASHVGQASET